MIRKSEVLIICTEYVKVICLNGKGHLEFPTYNLDIRYYLNDLASNHLKASESSALST